MAPSRSPHLTGGLFLLASAALLASVMGDATRVFETIGLALLGSAVAALGDFRVRGHRFGPVLFVLLLVVIGDRLAEHSVAVEQAWALPLAFGAYLLWIGMTGSSRSVVTALAPSMIGVAFPLALRAGDTGPTAPAAMTVLLLPIAAVAGVIAVVRARNTSARLALAQSSADLDTVVIANLELRSIADAQEAGHRIARLAAELLEAEGAVVWLEGPDRMLWGGGFGIVPPRDREPAGHASVEQVLLTGGVLSDGNEVLLPLMASGGVFGAVCVLRPRRAAETFAASLLQVFGAQAGYTLERLRAVESLIDARFVDPITGVGNHLAASASLAAIRAGDAVLLLSVDALATLRAIDGDARADLVLGQLGLHLRTETRAGDVVARFGDDVFFVLLRDLATNAEPVVRRILESWRQHGTAGPLRAGAALHVAECAPVDTLARATEALEAARNDRRPAITAAAERAARGRA